MALVRCPAVSFCRSRFCWMTASISVWALVAFGDALEHLGDALHEVEHLLVAAGLLIQMIADRLHGLDHLAVALFELLDGHLAGLPRVGLDPGNIDLDGGAAPDPIEQVAERLFDLSHGGWSWSVKTGVRQAATPVFPQPNQCSEGPAACETASMTRLGAGANEKPPPGGRLLAGRLPAARLMVDADRRAGPGGSLARGGDRGVVGEDVVRAFAVEEQRDGGVIGAPGGPAGGSRRPACRG